MKLRLTMLAFFLATFPALAQDKKIPLEVKGFTIFKGYPVTVSAPEGIGFYRWSVPPLVQVHDRGAVLELIGGPSGEIRVELKLEYGVYNEQTKKITYFTEYTSTTFEVFKGTVPVPPVPPGPDPKPPIPPGPIPPIPPTPVPVTSFRVIFVSESGKTLTAAQRSVMDAKIVRDYLNANTTMEGGRPGWRQYDPQQNVANEQPTMKKLWEAVQPQLTALPCVTIETNGKADILPLATTPEAQIEVFKAYKSGVK